MQKIKAVFGDNGATGKHKLEVDGEDWLDPEKNIHSGITEINVNLRADGVTKILVRMEMQECEIDAKGVIHINGLVFDEKQARQVYRDLKRYFEDEYGT